MVDGTDDCEMAEQNIQQSRITSLSLSEEECHWLICAWPWCTWLLKGVGTDMRMGFDLCSAQNIPMTNSESGLGRSVVLDRLFSSKHELSVGFLLAKRKDVMKFVLNIQETLIVVAD